MTNCQHCNIMAEIGSMKATIDATKDTCEEIKRSINGNGRPGLRERVEGLERWRSGIVAVLTFLMAAAGLYAKFR